MKIFEKFRFNNIGVGEAQIVNEMTVVPIVGDARGNVASPSSLKFERTTNYGTMEFKNEDPERPAIIPTNIMVRGKGAQDHAMSGSGVVSAKKTKRFDNACCIEASQGGYLRGEDNEYDILPVELRKAFLNRQFRQKSDYGKLWDRITRWIGSIPGFRGRARGHLRDFYDRPEIREALEEFAAEFEPVPGQIGALIMFGGVPVGLEIMPSQEHWQRYWQLLIRGCYGAEMIRLKKSGRLQESALVLPSIPSDATPEEVKEILEDFSTTVQESILPMLNSIDVSNVSQLDRDGNVSVKMIKTPGGGGDLIEQDGEPVYMSIVL
jgi:hypothetical protein